MKKVFLVLIVILSVSSLSAQTDTGMDLLRACNAIIQAEEDQDVSMEDQLLGLYWTGYLAGFNEAAVLIGTGTSQKIYCLPSAGIENEQLVRVVKKYLDEHPEDLHRSARIAVLLALSEAFPC